MSKKYKNKRCVYCAKNRSTTADHVIGRGFVPESLTSKTNFIKVPSCSPCNTEKSSIENYLMTVLPFGSQDIGGLLTMGNKIEKRLRYNPKLHQELRRGLEKDSNGNLTLPLNEEKIPKFFEFIVRGLLWHHYHLILDDDYEIRVINPTEIVDQYFTKLLSKYDVIENDPQQKILSYQGTKSKNLPLVSMWKFIILSEIAFSDGINKSTSVFVFIARKAFFQKPIIKKILSSED